jgi:predicted amidohydrolase
MTRKAEVRVAAVQMDAQPGQLEENLAQAATHVEAAASQGAQLIVLPELFSTGYEYTDRVHGWPEPLDGRTGTWVAETARRLGVHLVGSFPARVDGGSYIVALLAAPSGQRWVYRKNHVAMWENCYFDRGRESPIAETDLGSIGLLVCWDQVFADLARAYQGRVDLVCIPSSPPTWLGTLENEEGRILAQVARLRSAGAPLDGVDWFQRAQVAHARSASVPVVYAARCGVFHSPLPYGGSFLLTVSPKGALQVLRTVGTRFWLRCPMMGRSCILDAEGSRLVEAGQDGEAVLVADVGTGTPDPKTLPPVPTGRALVPGIPAWQLWFDDSMVLWGRWHRRRYAPVN